MKTRFKAAPPAAPTTGTSWAAAFSDTATLNRLATVVTSLASAGAPRSAAARATPFLSIHTAASET
ncbi:MAG TPA: hypothetical protein PLL32_08460, partial [Anaeromyxobacteraceae bacterium]|nr:hypothetical protein [Anaeromyxobacteraceae bacterium]